jgi:hypothetical protein
VVSLVIGNSSSEDAKKPPANQIRSGLLIKPSARIAQAAAKLALARFEAWLGLVDDISPTTTTNHAVIAMAAFE